MEHPADNRKVPGSNPGMPIGNMQILYRFGITAWRIRFSIAISAAVVLAYLLLSGGGFFIPLGALFSFAFSPAQPWNAVSYIFIHTGYHHLLENAVSLLAFAIVVELAVGAAEAAGIFFFSAIASAFIFGLVNPAYVLIGASAGISGMLGSAFLLNTKRTVLAIVAVLAITYFVVLPAVDYAFFVQGEALSAKSTQLKAGAEAALRAGDVNKAEQFRSEASKVELRQAANAEGVEFEVEAVVDPWIHAYGAVFGISWLWLRRRQSVLENAERLNRHARAAAQKLGRGSRGNRKIFKRDI